MMGAPTFTSITLAVTAGEKRAFERAAKKADVPMARLILAAAAKKYGVTLRDRRPRAATRS